MSVLGILLPLVFCSGLLAPSADGSADDPKLGHRERQNLERELRAGERELASFRSAIRKLEQASRSSSNTGRRSAIENLERMMGAVIDAGEAELSEDYRITRHSGEVDQVPTRELEESKGVRVGRRQIAPFGPNSTPPGYYRLARQQTIYVSCSRLNEQAIANQNAALEHYRSLVEEFAGLMEGALDERRSRLGISGERDGGAADSCAAAGDSN
jgi:hypothetical protein